MNVWNKKSRYFFLSTEEAMLDLSVAGHVDMF
jgi:hypothetical protein